MTQRWKHRPAGSNWGDFGDDDQLGRLNLITPARLRAAAAEVRVGRAFCLSLPLDVPAGNYHDLQRRAPRLQPLVHSRHGVKYCAQGHPDYPDVVCDDAVLLYTQFSTHWDALGHVGSLFDADADGTPEPRFYNGYRGGVEIGPALPGAADAAAQQPFAGARALGIERLAETGLQGRGVLVDLRRAFGDERRAIGYEELLRTLDAQRVEVEPGDILCLHTGQTAVLLAQGPEPDRHWLEHAFCHLDGCDERLLRWIDESGLAAIAADNFAIEAVPPVRSDTGVAYERLHELCLFKLGIPLGELWYLAELADWLAAHDRSRFLLTAPPLRLPGAVGSPVTPVATV